MRIYTRTGDGGNTRIIGGGKVRKDDVRVAAYGTLDELNALIGFTIAMLENEEAMNEELEHIQQTLFDCGSDLATPDGVRPYKTKKEHAKWLEEKIDYYSEIPPEIEEFILPGGSKGAALLHMARTVTRRAEREIVALMTTETINQEVLRYVNRLSDYFFAVARVVNFHAGKDDIFYENSAPVFRKDPKNNNI